MAANKTKNAKVEPAPIIEVDKAPEETEDRPGVRIVRIPSNRSSRSKKDEKDGSPAPGTKKDDDDLILGDEASTIKKEGEDEEDEEDTKIEVIDCFPLCCTTRWVFSPFQL